VAYRREIIADENSYQFTGWITRGLDDRVELLDAGNHRVIAVQDNLVIVGVDDLFDQAVIDEDLGSRVRFPLHPDLDFPPVSMQVGALSLIIEQAVAGINMYRFIDPDFHCALLGCLGYNVIMSEDQ